uniref:Uncharacterized protein n=1 Tax=Anopheles atroparvus TaxID=41427 RepID=A0A8W7N8S8_ANOAO
MKLTKLFFIVLLATVLLFGGQAEAGGLKHLGKHLEKMGQNVLHATEKVVHVLKEVKDLTKKDTNDS